MRLFNKTYQLFWVLLLGLFLFGVKSGQAQISGYKYRKKVTIQSSQVAGNLTNFPVLISLTDSDLRDHVQNANGYDIRFAANANGSNPLDHQIESYNSSTGKLVAWVKVPTLSSSANTSIYVFYDNPNISSNPSTTNVWDSNYKMVQHGNDLEDATSYNNDGILDPNTVPQPINGKIGGAGAFNGTNQFITIPHDQSLDMSANDRVTVSAWVWKNGNQNGWRAITQESDQSYNLQFNTGSNQPTFTIYDGDYEQATAPNNIATNRWVYVTGTFDKNTVRIYVNGTQRATVAAKSIAATNYDVGIGENLDQNGRYLAGRLDEVRISNTARSANWIRTEYNNQNNPYNFYTIGTQQITETTPPGAPQNVIATALGNGNITVTFDDVNETGSAQSGVGSYAVKRSTVQGGPYNQVGTITDDNSNNYTYTDNAASGGVTYYYVVTATDRAGNSSSNSSEASVTAVSAPPNVQSASVDTKALQLDYDKPLDENSVPSAGDYTVRVNGNTVSVSQVSISNDKVNMTLASAVSSSDNVTIDYTAGAKPVQGQAGRNAANFSGQQVTNNTLPPSQTGCFGLPLLSFRNPTLISGSAGQVGAVYRFSNVINGVDATVTIVKEQGARLYQNNIDQENQGGSPKAFQPYIMVTSGTRGYIDFDFQLYKAGTQTPKILSDFALSAIDIDGDNNNLIEFDGLKAGQSYTIEQTNNLNVSFNHGFNIFESKTAQVINGIDPTATKNIAYISYSQVSGFSVRAGNNGASNQERLYSFDFNSCIRNNFTNPEKTNVNDDIKLTKTVNETQAVAGDTLQYTITATNNGPQLATGLHVLDNLPPEVSYLSSTATQSSYSLSSGEWIVGNLSSGQTETLTIKATVNPNNIGKTATNKATVSRLNQTDPTQSNNTPSVSTVIGGKIKGTIFQDITGDALSDGDNVMDDASGDQQAVKNVRVALFKDQGDQVPGGDDTFIKAVTTDVSGHYQFGVPAGTYWLAVDSRSAGLSDGTTWPEQTYAGKDAFCDDGTGNTTGPRTNAGPCYGGRMGNKSDNLPATLADGSAPFGQHLFKIQITNSNITNIDAGFSYNVVTNVLDGDDDGTAARSVQGSLRQFIQNANAISGANAMRFVPAVPANPSNWWQVALASQLPAITGAKTTIDGKAYKASDGVTVRDANSGSSGHGGAMVGVGSDGVANTGDESNLPDYAKPELEINGGDHGTVLNLSADNGRVTHVAVYNANDNRGIQSSGTNNKIIQNYIGLQASGAGNPGSNLQLNQGIVVTNGTATVRSNRVAFTRQEGVRFEGNTSGRIAKNDMTNIGLAANNAGDAIAIENTNANPGIVIKENRIEASSAFGIDSYNSPGNFTIQNNSFINTGQGTTEEQGGIRLFGSGSTIRNNVITGAKTTGIAIITTNGAAKQNKISKNSIYNNGSIGIDLVQNDNITSGSPKRDGVTPNDGTTSSTLQNIGEDYPVFTTITFSSNTLHIEGYVGTASSKITGSQTVELFKADDDGNNDGPIIQGDGKSVAHGEGKTYLKSMATNSDGTFSKDITLSGTSNFSVGDFITATATDANNNTSEFSTNYEVKTPGVMISGTVYEDANHNGIKESSESGLSGVTIVLSNTGDNSCKSVQTGSDGTYQFTGVSDGNYKIIEAAGETTPVPNNCPPAVHNPDEYVSTTSDIIKTSVSGTPLVGKDFGDFHGSKLSGLVFNDNGTNSGTANDGTQNGGESGMDQVNVKLTDSGNSMLIGETKTAADGSYIFWIPHTANGDVLKVVEINSSADISTGGNAGTTGGSYTLATDIITFTEASGNTYAGVHFADVHSSSLINSGQKNLLPGTSGTFQHQFIARTDGDVTFTTSLVNNPQNVNFSAVIYRDSNGNGTIDSGESILDGSTSISVSAGQTINLIVKVNVPPGTNDAASSTSTLQASLDLANTSPVINQIMKQNDLVKVSTINGGLSLKKSVNKTQAKPGETLTYTITYTNNGSDPLNNLKIKDSTPPYTTYSSSTCGALPDSLTNCSITTATSNQTGTVTWTFAGTLAPGAKGMVTYQVIIQN